MGETPEDVRLEGRRVQVSSPEVTEQRRVLLSFVPKRNFCTTWEAKPSHSPWV